MTKKRENAEVKGSKWDKHPRVLFLGKESIGEDAIEGITPEKIERRNFRSNKPHIPGSAYFNTHVSKDSVRHFVNGMGDDNPLFTDEEYAKKSKYRSLISPGTYLYTVQWVTAGSGMPGIHAWYSGGDWEWYRPVAVGDEFTSVCVLRELVEKKGRMAGGNSMYISYTDVIYVNQKKEIVGKELQHTVWAGRAEAEKAGKYHKVPMPAYSKEDWIRILDAYDQEELRGSNTRFWEDVKVGDKVGPMIKGPLSVRDEIAWIMGAGSPFFKAHKLEFDYEMRHPKALEHVAETGESDVPELVHVFDAFARTIGVERAYDYGCQRMSWLGQLFTNWIGDDGFLWKMSGDLRTFNQVGDVTTFEGTVTRKYVESGKHCVDIEAWAKNQKGEYSITPHTSIAVLPSKKNGPVVYPEPAPAIVAEVKRARPLDEMIADGSI